MKWRNGIVVYKKQLNDMQKLVLYFVIYSFLGWILETIFALFVLGKFVKRTLTESFTKNLCTKLQYLVAKKPIKSMSKAMDYKSYGGALFLGVKKPVVKAHGSSDEKLFEYTIIQAEKFVENKAVDKMIEAFSDLSV